MGGVGDDSGTGGGAGSGSVGSVAEVIQRMEQLDSTLPAGDGVRAFNLMYLVTTRQVDAALAGARFADPEFLARLDVVFANLYLDALAGHEVDPGRTPRCWRALIDARTRPGTCQLQFAIAGMNAHINYDLARALVLTAEELGGDPGAGGRRSDFLAINRVLAQTQPMVRRELLTGPLAEFDEALGDGDDRVAMWGIEKAREFAWATAQTLWAVRGTDVAVSFTEGLDRMVEMTSRLLLRVGV